MAQLLPRFLVVALALSTAAIAAPEKWKKDIDAFVAADAAHPVQPHGIVFIGSSSIVKWKSLSQDFPGLNVVNRGFGGSELADSAAYVNEIVVPCRPRAVVLYAGDNDIAAGKTAEAVLTDFRTFRKKIHEALPSTQIFYLSIKYSPSRAKFEETMRRTNELIAADCAAASHCTFVDVNSTMLDASGHARPELFEADQLHMKPSSYALWVKKLAPLLQP